MRSALSFISGLVFGLGLILSGMTDPAKVIAFLDVAGAWDASLAFVMAGAITVSAFFYRLSKHRTRAVLGGPMHVPVNRTIDRKLILGALIFGAGWGMAGFCPGPALVSLPGGESKVWVFVAAMLTGMLLYEILDRRAHRPGA